MIFLLQLLIVGMSSVARGRLVTEFLPSFTVWPCWPSELSKKKTIKSNDISNKKIFLLQLLIVGMSSVARGRLVTEFLPSFTVWPCWPSELSKRKPIKSNDLGNSMAIMCRSVWWCECRLLAFDYRVFYRVFFFFTVGRWPRWPSVPFARPCVTPHGHCPSWLVGLAPFVLHSVSPFRFPFLSVGRPRRPINEREHPLPPTPHPPSDSQP